MYNFSGGSLGDEGSDNAPLTNTGSVSVSGVDGSASNAMSMNNFTTMQCLNATDAGLPSGDVSRSYGFWFKGTAQSHPAYDQWLLAWGANTGYECIYIVGSAERLCAVSYGTTDINAFNVSAVDGKWHFVVLTADKTDPKGPSRRLYVDGKLMANGVGIGSLVLGGASAFRIGQHITVDKDGGLTGQVDSVFVCNYALTPDQITKLYTKSALSLQPSPKSVGEHIEAFEPNDLLATFDTLEPQHTVDLTVA